jgi:hypothetical protein
MAVAGYSGTPLLKKLGLKEEFKIWLLNPPEDYFELLQKDVSGQVVPYRMIPDWAHLFARSGLDMEKGMDRLKPASGKNPKLIIWVSWYKKGSGIPTDLTEDGVRGWGLRNGLVDIKVCAVSAEWSGLKLVVPLSLR